MGHVKNFRINARLDAKAHAALRRIMKYLACSRSQAIRSALIRIEHDFFGDNSYDLGKRGRRGAILYGKMKKRGSQ
jgi:hypothetical protein